MFTCLGRRPALASFPVTFSAIVVPGCPSSLLVPGCSHYPGSWVWRMDSILSFSHYAQQSPPWHLHEAAGPLWQFGLQIYGPQPGWLELSHRVDLMLKCAFVPMPEAAAWHTVVTQQQTCKLSIFHMVFLQPGEPVFQVLPGIHVSIAKLPRCKLFKCHERIYGERNGDGMLDFLDISSLLFAELPIHNESPTHQPQGENALDSFFIC